MILITKCICITMLMTHRFNDSTSHLFYTCYCDGDVTVVLSSRRSILTHVDNPVYIFLDYSTSAKLPRTTWFSFRSGPLTLTCNGQSPDDHNRLNYLTCIAHVIAKNVACAKKTTISTFFDMI